MYVFAPVIMQTRPTIWKVYPAPKPANWGGGERLRHTVMGGKRKSEKAKEEGPARGGSKGGPGVGGRGGEGRGSGGREAVQCRWLPNQEWPCKGRPRRPQHLPRGQAPRSQPSEGWCVRGRGVALAVGLKQRYIGMAGRKGAAGLECLLLLVRQVIVWERRAHGKVQPGTSGNGA